MMIESNKPFLIVMCGLQASGKSTKAEELAELIDATILSSDDIREKHKDWNNNTVFESLYSDMNSYLKEGKNVILDATNVTIKSRRQIFLNLKQDCIKVCYILNTPFLTCLNRLNLRNEHTPDHIIPTEALIRYYHSFEIPFYEEGWDEIVIEYEPSAKQSKNFLSRCLDESKDFDQKNKHHTQNLGDHLNFVEQKLKKLKASKLMIRAGKYHDIGKLFTQTYGEDGNCHYYNHDSVGAYLLLCEAGIYRKKIYKVKDTLRWLFYINYHMKLHNVITDKSEKKWMNIFGKDLYTELRLFEKADKSRPEHV